VGTLWATCEVAKTEEKAHGLMTHALTVDTYPQSDVPLEESLRAFWELESLGISTNDKSVYDDFCEHVKFEDGRSLPWKQPRSDLPNNYHASVRRLNGLLKRLRQDAEVLDEYDRIIKSQIQQGIVEVMPNGNPDVDGVHYLPHHAVIRRDKATTRLRIVFDASAKADGVSLNDCLLAGPKLDQKILAILLRFRAHQIAVMADIEKVFLMVSVAEPDRDYLRFLWIDSINKEKSDIQVLRFARVVFGVTSSPFLLNGTIKYHLERNSEKYPELVAKLLRSTYVDDVVTSAESEEEAYELYTQSKELLKQARFDLRKFASNSRNLQIRVDSEAPLPQIPRKLRTPTLLSLLERVRSR
jgi:hypothetical protein